MPARTWKAFVSTTYLDNVGRRKIVEEAILSAGRLPVGMDRFAAGGTPMGAGRVLRGVKRWRLAGASRPRPGTGPPVGPRHMLPAGPAQS